MTPVTRRTALFGGLAALGVGALAACGDNTASTPGGASRPLQGPPLQATPQPGQKVVETTLTARESTVDLGGITARTWAYDDALPGKVIRANAGDFLRVALDNRLPADTLSLIHI